MEEVGSLAVGLPPLFGYHIRHRKACSGKSRIGQLVVVVVVVVALDGLEGMVRREIPVLYTEYRPALYTRAYGVQIMDI